MFTPILSYIRSIILLEQYRALLMNLFRVPLNVVVIILLLLTNYLNPFSICLIVSIILMISWVSSLYLFLYSYKHKLHRQSLILENLPTSSRKQSEISEKLAMPRKQSEISEKQVV
jgi:hypothetical protein